MNRDEFLRAAYPLTWPDRQPRTPAHRRRSAKFKLSFGQSRDELLRELDLLAARNVVLSTNVPTRRDGIPYADARQPDDPGVAVYFDRRIVPPTGPASSRSFTIACDSYTKVAWNLRAVGVTVEMLEQAFTGFAALPPVRAAGEKHWSEVLGVDPTRATRDRIRAAFHELVQIHHPDHGGDSAVMAEINLAFAKAIQEVRA